MQFSRWSLRSNLVIFLRQPIELVPGSDCEFWAHKALNDMARSVRSVIGKPVKSDDKVVGSIISAEWVPGKLERPEDDLYKMTNIQDPVKKLKDRLP